MPLRAFNVSALLLITTIVVQLAAPLTSGGVCSLLDSDDSAAFTSLFASVQEGLSSSIGNNDHTMPTAFPKVEAQSAAHGVATISVWDPMHPMLSLPVIVFRAPFSFLTDRLSTNFAPLSVWRPPIPFLSSL